jgi:ribosomal protein S14
MSPIGASTTARSACPNGSYHMHQGVQPRAGGTLVPVKSTPFAAGVPKVAPSNDAPTAGRRSWVAAAVAAPAASMPRQNTSRRCVRCGDKHGALRHDGPRPVRPVHRWLFRRSAARIIVGVPGSSCPTASKALASRLFTSPGSRRMRLHPRWRVGGISPAVTAVKSGLHTGCVPSIVPAGVVCVQRARVEPADVDDAARNRWRIEASVTGAPCQIGPHTFGIRSSCVARRIKRRVRQ